MPRKLQSQSPKHWSESAKLRWMCSRSVHQPLCLWTVCVWRILKCDSRADKADDNHARCPTQCYTVRHNLNSLINMETLGSFNDMVLLSLQYQGFPTQQPVQQHTEGPTYEVGDEPCSTHSEQRRHLHTFQLTEGEHPFLFLLSFYFFLPHFSLLGLWSPSLSCDWKSCVSGNHSESAERCMPASPRGTTHSLTSSACESTHRHALRHVPIARTHGKFGLVLRCHCAWLCWWWNGRPFIAGLSEWKKRKGPRSSSVWPSMAEWSGDKSSRAVNSEQSDLICCYSVILFLISFYFSIWCFFWQRANGQQGGWMGGSSLSDVFHLLLLRCQVWWFCETTKHNSPLPPKKYTFIIYTHLRQSKANCSRKTFGGIIFNIKQWHQLSKW